MAEETDPDLRLFPNRFGRVSYPMASLDTTPFSFLVGIRFVETNDEDVPDGSPPSLSSTYFNTFRSHVDLPYSSLLARMRDWLPQDTKSMQIVLHLSRFADHASFRDKSGQRLLHLVDANNCYYALDLMRMSSANIILGVTLGSAEAVAGLGKQWKTKISQKRVMKPAVKWPSPPNENQVIQTTFPGSSCLRKLTCVSE